MIKNLIEETQHHLAVMKKMENIQKTGDSFDLESHMIFLKSCHIAQKNLSQIMYNMAKNTMLNWQVPNDSKLEPY